MLSVPAGRAAAGGTRGKDMNILRRLLGTALWAGPRRDRTAWTGALAAAVLAGASSITGAQAILGTPITLGNPAATVLGQGGIGIARAANGRALAVWSDNRTGNQDVYGVLLGPTGLPLSPPVGLKLIGAAGTNEGDPRIAACGNTFLVVWGNGVGDGDTTDLFATRINTNGVVLDPTPIVISNQPGVQHNQRQPASDGVDTFLVPFRTASDSIYGGISTMRVSASTGATMDLPGGYVLAMGDSSQGLKKNASASFGAGKFLVTWDDERDRAAYPGEAIDIFGAFVDPALGTIIGSPFATTRAFSCQEGSRSAFDGANFFVTHNDERITNCVTSDITGERVTPAGVVLDQVDPTGMVGGLWIATDPLGFPNSRQGGSNVTASPCTRLLTYYDLGMPSTQVALRMKRLFPDGTIEGGQGPAQPGALIALGSQSSGVFTRVETVEVSPNTYLLAYALSARPTVRTAKFAAPMVTVIGQGKLSAPRGVAVDAQGNIVVADTQHNRIQVFDRTGKLLLAFGTGGTGNGQLIAPFGVALDTLGNIYVADSSNNRVQVFNSAGAFKFKFGTLGGGNGQFNYPLGIAVGPTGNIYVADTDNNRVQVFSGTGVFLSKFGAFGSALGQFKAARAICFNAAGNIYVADRDNNRVQIFTSTGVPMSQITSSFNAPRGVAIDHAGRLFVADSNNNRVVVFNAQGQYYATIGTPGSGLGQFNFTPAVAVDSAGRLHVSDAYNNRIQVFGCIP